MPSRKLSDTKFASPACFMASGSIDVLNTVDNKVIFDTDIIENTVWSLVGGELSVSEAGTYSIAYSIPINDDSSDGATRCRVYSWLERNGIVIQQSRAQDYARETSGGQGVSTSFIAQLGAGDTVRLMVRSSLNVDLSTETNQTQISVFRISE